MITTTGDMSCNTLYATTIVTGGAIDASSGTYENLLVTDTLTIGDATTMTLDSLGAITTSGTITGGSLESDAGITAVGTITGGSLESDAGITAVGTITGGSLASDAGITAVDTITGGSLESDAGITAVGTITGGTITDGAATMTGGDITLSSGSLYGSFNGDASWNYPAATPILQLYPSITTANGPIYIDTINGNATRFWGEVQGGHFTSAPLIVLRIVL